MPCLSPVTFFGESFVMTPTLPTIFLFLKLRLFINLFSSFTPQVFIEASSSAQNSVQLSLNSPLIQSIDRSLQHGLVNLLHGYWPLVRTFCHSQTLHSIDISVGPQGSNRLKGIVPFFHIKFSFLKISS